MLLAVPDLTAQEPMNGYNFTEDVRKALAVSREEAGRLRHEYVGPEHVLLGLLQEPEGAAAGVLRSLNVDPAAIQQRVEATVKVGQSAQPTGPDLPYTTRAKKVLEFAMNEARELNDSYVGSEHLLLGLLREKEGIAAQLLTASGVTVESARAAVLQLRGKESGRESTSEAMDAVRMFMRGARRRPGRRSTIRYFIRCALLGTGGSAVGILTAHALLGISQSSPSLLLECTMSGVAIAGFLLIRAYD